MMMRSLSVARPSRTGDLPASRPLSAWPELMTDTEHGVARATRSTLDEHLRHDEAVPSLFELRRRQSGEST